MSTNTSPTTLDVSGLDAFQAARVRGYIDRILDEEAEKATKEKATAEIPNDTPKPGSGKAGAAC